MLSCASVTALLGGIHGFTQLHRGLGQGVGLFADGFRIGALLGRLQVVDGGLDSGLFSFANLIAMFGQSLFGRVDQGIRRVDGFDQFLAGLVSSRIGFGFLDHVLDIRIRQAAVGLNTDRVLLVGRLVLGSHVHDAVGVDIEGHLDLRHAARCRRNTHQVELTQDLVVRSHRTLALEHADGHGRLVVLGGREDLGLLGRDGGVALDQRGEHTAQGLDAQGQRGHVQQQHVLDVALQNASLNGSAQSHDFIRVHTLVRLLAEVFLHGFLNRRHAGHTTDQHHFVDVRSLQAGVGQSLLARLDGAGDQIFDQSFQLSARQLDVQVQRARGVHGDERQVDLVLGGRGQFLLGLFSLFLQALKGEFVRTQVNALLLLELVGEVVDQTHVEVFTAKEGVAVGRLHFEHAVADLEDRDVEGTTAEVVNGDLLTVVLVQTIGQSGSGRLVDDAQDFEAGDLAGVLGGLTLGVVEVGRNRDDGLGDGLTQIGLGRFLHLGEGEGRNLLRRVVLAVGLDPGVAVRALRDFEGNHVLVLGHNRIAKGAADQALDGEEGVGRIGDSLTLCGLTHQNFTTVLDGDHRRGGASALGVFDHLGVGAVHDGDARVGGTEVDADNLGHGLVFFTPCGGRCGGLEKRRA